MLTLAVTLTLVVAVEGEKQNFLQLFAHGGHPAAKYTGGAYIHARAHTHTHARTHTHMRAHTYTYASARAYTRMHAYTDAHCKIYR